MKREDDKHIEHDHKQHEHQNHNQHDEHNHDDHDHSSHGHHDHGDMVNDFKKRFYISLIVTIPILILSPMIQDFIGVDWGFPADQYILFKIGRAHV